MTVKSDGYRNGHCGIGGWYNDRYKLVSDIKWLQYKESYTEVGIYGKGAMRPYPHLDC